MAQVTKVACGGRFQTSAKNSVKTKIRTFVLHQDIIEMSVIYYFIPRFIARIQNTFCLNNSL